jgi:hypothetical protein
MKTADRENPNSPDRLCKKPSPWGGRQEASSLIHAGWRARKIPAVGEVFFLAFPFIELIGTWLKVTTVVCFGVDLESKKDAERIRRSGRPALTI